MKMFLKFISEIRNNNDLLVTYVELRVALRVCMVQHTSVLEYEYTCTCSYIAGLYCTSGENFLIRFI